MRRLLTLIVALAGVAALAGCVTTDPYPQNRAGGAVTVYGTVDAGVGRSR